MNVSSARGGTGKEDLCQLRLVSKLFAKLVCIVLFPTLHLQIWETPGPTPEYTRHQEIIVALASGSTAVFDSTQKLYFRRGPITLGKKEDASEVTSVQQIIADNIFDAVCALKNLRTVW